MRYPAFALVLLVSCSRRSDAPKATAQYVDSKACAGCHAEIARSYKETGMGRSFFRATPANMAVEKWNGPAFEHAASARSYRMLRREDRFFLRRWQRGHDGQEANVQEVEIHWVMGSGNHVRSYLHRTPQGRLAELPIAWYADKGGFYAMSPGYDRADHQEWRRKISTDCMFCHNAYPATDRMPEPEPVFAGPIPEGIDCQRCHGPGSAHVETAGRPGATQAQIRATVVNPAKLPRDRSLEVCMQCHLETTSFPLPNSLIRSGRGAFSYRPGEPLGDFALYFDHAARSGREGKFEIVNSAYRLRQSKCFTASNALQCITCHDPHRPSSEPQARARYEKACRQCHAAPFDAMVAKGAHTRESECAKCHMPRRRTEDVVHAVMTDHKIQRRPPAGNLLAPLPERHEKPGESYRGEVALYYPPDLPPSERALYLGLAQVVQRSNLGPGIPALAMAIAAHRPREPQFRIGLGEALMAAARRDEAIAAYRDALAIDPRSIPALRNLGEALREAGKLDEAVLILENARALAPDSSTVAHALGLSQRAAAKPSAARASFQVAVDADPDHAEAWNGLGGMLLESDSPEPAVRALRNAILHKPDFPEARTNLGNALLAMGGTAEGLYHLREAVRLAPGSAPARYALAGALVSQEQLAPARRELETAIQLQPAFAEAHEALGGIEASGGDWTRAIARYNEALRLRPGFDRAHLGLGSALAATGRAAEARQHLEKAAASSNSAIRDEARDVLRMLGSER